MGVIKHVYTQKIDTLTRHGEGIYTILPYGKFVLNKIEQTIKRAMSKLEIKEILMPCAVHNNVFAKAYKLKPNMFIIGENKLTLAPTAEEIALSLPSILSLNKLYQIQLKFRNETRPCAGLIRGYEFIMKDCYVMSRTKRALLLEFKRIMTEYKQVFRYLGVRCAITIASSNSLNAEHSFEFVVPSVLFTSSYFVHAHALTINKIQYLNFTQEYVERNKVLITLHYLSLTGLELAHTFVFGKIPKLNAWFASFGIGISRMLGFALKHKLSCSKLLTVCDVAVLRVARLAANFARYVYCTLRCTTLNCVLFETGVHISKLLGMLRRLPPMLIAFVNVPLYKFLVKLEPQTHQIFALKRTHNLLHTVTFVHALKAARVC
ncbi:Proline--tRNA ligase [Candidatus Hodgkinia cicadicola]|nr:Proline--tRNA ligase [Candidatus Hodgkinia cicadicola]